MKHIKEYNINWYGNHYRDSSGKIEELSEYLQELFDKYNLSQIDDIEWFNTKIPNCWAICEDASDEFYRIKINIVPERYNNFIIDLKKLIPHIEKRMITQKNYYKISLHGYPKSAAALIWIKSIKRGNFIKRFFEQ